ncbi:hypothetical protein V496_06863 [Pseudogymnoascus sp. VKM F-4515 (FW-2607)]|nr:hypothetical protein V496_06863 [Pseudogymnoascus sp. VKM F-4515 (FW-2607)]
MITYTYLGGLVLAYCIYRLLRIGRRDPRLPPGPPTIPILGNAHQIPTTGLGKKFEEWAKIYGPVYSLKVFSGTMIVIADRKSVYQLCDKKGSIYSDRPPLPVPLFISRNAHMTMEPQGPSWREKRTVVTKNLNPKTLDEKHFKVQEAESILFMNNLLDDPDQIFEWAKLYSTSVASIIAWGFRAKDFNSFWFKDFFHFMDKWLEAIEPGANPPIDVFPWLWYLPGKWKTRAYETRSIMDKLWSDARAKVDERRAIGDVREAMIDLKLDEYNTTGWKMSQHAFNTMFGELLEAGADTTANMLLTLILAFTKHPEVQVKARKELDAVCGTERTPLFSDFDQLPYINCIVKEAMRWRPTSDLGLPHKVSQDDWYNGMFIPKDSVIWIGIWTMHQDPTLYPEPEKFKPERFAKHTKLANEICPGIHLAERSMWRITAKLLWAFEFSEKPDAPLDVNAYNSANLVRPLEYTVNVKPRSAAHLAVIRRELAGAMDFLKKYD